MNDLPCGPTQSQSIRNYLVAHLELEQTKEELKAAHKKVKTAWNFIRTENRFGLQPPTQETFDA